MKVSELIEKLMACKPDDEIVVSVGHGDGYFSLHKIAIQTESILGDTRPVIFIGEPADDATEKAKA